jgi:hypothetical protein
MAIPSRFRQMIGYIDADNAASLGLHAQFGFARVGLLPGVAYPTAAGPTASWCSARSVPARRLPHRPRRSHGSEGGRYGDKGYGVYLVTHAPFDERHCLGSGLDQMHWTP